MFQMAFSDFFRILLGDVMRLRAVTLANSGAQLKFNASGAAQIRQNAMDSLK